MLCTLTPELTGRCARPVEADHGLKVFREETITQAPPAWGATHRTFRARIRPATLAGVH